MPATRSPSICFLHFVTLWLWLLTFQPKKSYHQDNSLYQVWTLWDHSFFSYAVDKLRDRHTHTQTDMDERLKPGFHYPSWRPELTAQVDGWPVSITCQHGPCWRARISTSRVDGLCWRLNTSIPMHAVQKITIIYVRRKSVDRQHPAAAYATLTYRVRHNKIIPKENWNF